MPLKYQILRRTFDTSTMKAKALLNGKEVEVEGTWVWAPDLSWYDTTNRRWINRSEWKFIL